jgi:hypothetical protein
MEIHKSTNLHFLNGAESIGALRKRVLNNICTCKIIRDILQELARRPKLKIEPPYNPSSPDMFVYIKIEKGPT